MRLEKGDLVKYFGEIYEVFQVLKHSDMIVLKKRGARGFEVYTWQNRCRKIEQ